MVTENSDSRQEATYISNQQSQSFFYPVFKEWTMMCRYVQFQNVMETTWTTHRIPALRNKKVHFINSHSFVKE